MQTLNEYLKQQGIHQGIQQEKASIAKNMLQQGSDDQFIALVTGVSKNELAKLKENL